MKRLLTITLVLGLLISAASASGQSRYGVIGGFSFSHASDVNNRGTMTLYSAGLTYQLKLPLGFSIQPSLIYHAKGARIGTAGNIERANMDLTAGYLELPVSFQWGPDLLLFRPFLDVTPYIGVGLNNHLACSVAGEQAFDDRNVWSTAGLARMEYGLGLGVGIEIWRFQVVGRYNWNFGPLYRDSGNVDQAAKVFTEGTFSDGSNFRGLTLSVALLF